MCLYILESALVVLEVESVVSLKIYIYYGCDCLCVWVSVVYSKNIYLQPLTSAPKKRWGTGKRRGKKTENGI